MHEHQATIFSCRKSLRYGALPLHDAKRVNWKEREKLGSEKMQTTCRGYLETYLTVALTLGSDRGVHVHVYVHMDSQNLVEPGFC